MALYQPPAQPGPLINPCWDPVFKAVFTKDTPQSKKALRGFLSAVLERELEVVSIAANEVPVSRLSDRQIRYDINCVLGKREKANVEMTLFPDAREVLKLEYYLGRLFTSQELRGAKLSYRFLRRCYQISLLANRSIFKDGHFYHRFVYHDPLRRCNLGGRTAVITLELKKLAAPAESALGELTKKEKWGLFFAYYAGAENQGLIQRLAETGEDIGMAQGVIQGFTAEEAAFFHEISKEKYELDMISHEDSAREEGRAAGYKQGLKRGMEQGLERGMEQGLEQGRRQVIKDLLNYGMTPAQVAGALNIPLDAVIP
ncbi:MAG: PD-(D/E)XK nuclease family transposase [Treponema sp.]|jgi:predicted transposase/invertase (TIGR01784 family)|nr:PD-(D/E)XK nuclease family transposase [Treponema sp.]